MGGKGTLITLKRQRQLAVRFSEHEPSTGSYCVVEKFRKRNLSVSWDH